MNNLVLGGNVWLTKSALIINLFVSILMRKGIVSVLLFVYNCHKTAIIGVLCEVFTMLLDEIDSHLSGFH